MLKNILSVKKHQMKIIYPLVIKNYTPLFTQIK